MCIRDRGWRAIGARLRGLLPARRGRAVVCVECYPGVFEEEVERALTEALQPSLVVRTAESFRPPAELQASFEKWLTSDVVFGRMNSVAIEDFFAPAALAAARARIGQATGTILVIGAGASLFTSFPEILVYADMARWEIQQRQRRGEIANLGAENIGESAAMKYKRAYFIDWRAADRAKIPLFEHADFYLDTNDRTNPKMISGRQFLAALELAARRPFRMVPFFDPGPWGGQWMKEVCDLDVYKRQVPITRGALVVFAQIVFNRVVHPVAQKKTAGPAKGPAVIVTARNARRNYCCLP